MRNSILSVLVYFVLLTTTVYAQQKDKTSPLTHQQDTLYISYTKTTSLVFQHAVKSVDMGSRDILAQKAKGVENILQIKAGSECFEETNLTVVTANGKLHCFTLRYDPSPNNFTIVVDRPKYDDHEIVFSPGTFDQGLLAEYCKLALMNRKTNARESDGNYGITFLFNGLFINENVMYLRFRVENNSNINFEVDQLRFLIRDKKKAKRTSSQEIELQPVFLPDAPTVVRNNSRDIFVVALPKFTIPDNKYLAIQITEKAGGRHYELHLSNSRLLKPILLGQL